MTGRPICIVGMVLGALLMLGPLIGLLVSGWHITGIVEILHRSGMGDPQLLSGHMHSVFVSTVIGVLFCPIGLFILTLSLIFFYRGRNRNAPDRPT